MAGTIRVGTSGWAYAPLRGSFYPKGLPHGQELFYASRQFDTIEINATFYRLQHPTVFRSWHDETPETFVFAVKGSRFITQTREGEELKTGLANFFASGLLHLGRKLGPILWQFPPARTFEADAFRAFLALLPQDTEAARKLAQSHDLPTDRCGLLIEDIHPLRHAVEIRNDTFRAPAFIDLLREFGVALVCADSPKWPLLTDVTADFIYCRFHGARQLYVSGYDEEALNLWARRTHTWSQGSEPRDACLIADQAKPLKAGRDVFMFFNNTAQNRAFHDAMRLKTLLRGDLV
ncbi:DUF72 domain-containing protein [Beijerinckia mobilis]|uniref:DUF72 domain-containing protein n=1 Tax=Beijerinckia mobilis TaxID=231434 RepID=UPI00054F6B19|nr:DUF72 domain-containing protein [Beijerinckia mobilis]